jgi:pantetheine-phosphate adenylyltransferase
MSTTERVAVYPGSFDPITNGHVDIVRRSLQVFDRVVVAIAQNSDKTPLFTPAERVAMIDDVFRDDSRVRGDLFQGLLVEYVHKIGARVIIRGLRAVADFEYEFQMTMMNRHLVPTIETIFMMTSETHFYTSSRLVREVATLGGSVAGLVPDTVVRRLRERLRTG